MPEATTAVNMEKRIVAGADVSQEYRPGPGREASRERAFLQ